jgi:toxin CptA
VETLTVAVGPSRQLTILVTGMHGFAAAMCWLVPLPLWLAAMLMPLVVASAGYHLGRDGLRSLPAALVALRLHADRRCEFQTRSGAWQEAELLGSSFVSPFLTVLNLQPAGRRFARHLVILPDALASEDFRRLRVWLKWR